MFDDLSHLTKLALGSEGKLYVANDSEGVNGELHAFTSVPIPVACGPLCRPQPRTIRQCMAVSGSSGGDRE